LCQKLKEVDSDYRKLPQTVLLDLETRKQKILGKRWEAFQLDYPYFRYFNEIVWGATAMIFRRIYFRSWKMKEISFLGEIGLLLDCCNNL